MSSSSSSSSVIYSSSVPSPTPVSVFNAGHVGVQGVFQGNVFATFAPTAFAAAAPSPHEQAKAHFTGGRRYWMPPTPLPGGRVADFGGFHVHIANDDSFSPDRVAQCEAKNAKWLPKGAKTPHFQRSPLHAVDNLCVKRFANHPEPHVVLGLWDKVKEVSGREVRIRGLVLAGGGHVRGFFSLSPRDAFFDSMS